VKATEVTAGLTESNGSLLPGLWRGSLYVTCGLTACTPASAPGQTLGNEYGKTLLLLFFALSQTFAILVFNLFRLYSYSGWLSSRVVSVLDSGAEGSGFKSQSRRCRVTVFGELFTPIVPLFTKQQN